MHMELREQRRRELNHLWDRAGLIKTSTQILSWSFEGWFHTKMKYEEKWKEVQKEEATQRWEIARGHQAEVSECLSLPKATSLGNHDNQCCTAVWSLPYKDLIPALCCKYMCELWINTHIQLILLINPEHTLWTIKTVWIKVLSNFKIILMYVLLIRLHGNHNVPFHKIIYFCGSR